MKTIWINLMMFLLLFIMSTGVQAMGVDVSSPNLPPEGVYVSDSDFSYMIPGFGVLTLSGSRLYPIVSSTQRESIGNDESESFNSIFNAIELGSGLDISLTGPVQMITRNRVLSTTGLFDAEIVSASLSGFSGGLGITIRESPTLASTGQTDIIDLGGGMYHIDSFFDVFAELSIDGGSTWIAPGQSVRMTLTAVPLPPAVVLLAFGLLGLAGFGKKSKQ